MLRRHAVAVSVTSALLTALAIGVYLAVVVTDEDAFKWVLILLIAMFAAAAGLPTAVYLGDRDRAKREPREDTDAMIARVHQHASAARSPRERFGRWTTLYEREVETTVPMQRIPAYVPPEPVTEILPLDNPRRARSTDVPDAKTLGLTDRGDLAARTERNIRDRLGDFMAGHAAAEQERQRPPDELPGEEAT